MEAKYLLNQLQNLGYASTTVVERDIIQRQINKLIRKQNNSTYQILNQYLANQIWDQVTDKGNKTSITVGEYVNILVLAKVNVQQNLVQLQNKINQRVADKKSVERYLNSLPQPIDQKRKFQLQQQLRKIQQELIQHNNDAKDFTGDLNNLNVLFGKKVASNIQSQQNNRMNASGNRNNPSQRMNSSGYQPLNNSALNNQVRQSSQIFSARVSDKKITALFVITAIYLIIQLLIMNHKYHFLNILLGLGLIGIFGCNYFDRFYLRFLMVLTVFSFILDLVWLIVKTGSYWNDTINSPDSNINKGFLRFIVFFTVIIMVLKVIIGFILFVFRSAPQTSLIMFGYNINLTGDSMSPISKLFPAAGPIVPQN